MSKLTDKQLNRILRGRNLPLLVSRSTDENGNPVKGLKRDKHLFLAKNQNKGVHWDSLLNDTVDRVRDFLKEQLDKLEWSSEYYDHILSHVEQFLDMATEEGLYTADDYWGFNPETTKALLERRENGEQTPLTPPLLLLDFTSDVADVSNRLRKVVQELVSRLKQNGDPTHLYERETQRWVIEEARKLRLMNRDEDDALAKLLDEKEQIIAFYRGQADLFRLGNSPVADALAFAAMWETVMLEQSSRARETDSKRFTQAVDAFKEQFGFDPHGDTALLHDLQKRVPKYQYTRLSSVLTLFPRGAMQFLDLVENERITKYSKPVQHMTGFFGHPELTDEKRDQIKGWEGTEVLLLDGVVVGTKFQFATEDYGHKGFATSDPRQAMVREGYDPEDIDYVCSHKYLRGGKVWTGGLQQATILYVETARKDGQKMAHGVKLWLEDIQPMEVPSEVLEKMYEQV